MPDFLGIDLGTSSIKIAQFDEKGRLIAGTSQVCRQPGENQLAFDRVFGALVRGCDGLKSLTLTRPPVSAIGISSQVNSFALIGAGGQCLSPVHLWTGDWASSEADDLNQRLGKDALSAATGMTSLTGQLLAPKYLHMLQQHPQLESPLAGVWQLHDLLMHRLCGRAVTSPSLWSLTGLYDLEHGRWWDPMLECLGLSSNQLPELADAGSAGGALTQEAASQLGLPEEIPVAVGTLDHLAGAIGVGNLMPHLASVSMGTTSSVVVTHAYRPPPMKDGVIGPHPVHPDAWYALAWTGISSAALNWWAGRHGGEHRLPELLEAVGRTLDKPFPLGAAPLESRDGGYTFVFNAGPGRDINRMPDEIEGTRAILERIIYEIGLLLEQACGNGPVHALTAIGGGARSDVWLQRMADMLELPVIRPTCIEASARGASRLAARAAGILEDLRNLQAGEGQRFMPAGTTGQGSIP